MVERRSGDGEEAVLNALLQMPQNRRPDAVHLIMLFDAKRTGNGGTTTAFLTKFHESRLDPLQSLCSPFRRRRYSSSSVFEQLQQKSWHPQKSFTPPNPNNTHFVFIMSINDAKRRVHDLSQMFDIELGHHTPAQRMRAQPLNRAHDVGNKPFPNIGYTFVRVIGLQVFKVLDRGCGKRYSCLVSHRLTSDQGVFSPRRARSRGLLPGPSAPSPLPA